MSIQSRWNPWLHFGNNLTFSPSTASDKQTAHSSPSGKSLDWKITSGRDLSIESSSPLLTGS
ncbi:hypothetical protein SADUNF_Sadunf01G0135100 [Salix dunnii]|uniref:Uncharacterized protein n=1 Tax=Salix dunnii TaxID=1413687 RepID=A0A835NC60_9ROSI|nr:hypothetical protein SADUNF_Sadunf01G0135100 [Salix dunnii]